MMEGTIIMWATDWNNLDLDRLHSRHIERGSGNTMSIIALMVGDAILGQPANAYLYVAENYFMRQTICRDFRDILAHENVSFTPNGGYRRGEVNVVINRLFVKGWKGVRTFDFMMASELETGCRGRRWDRVFVDVSAVTRIQFQQGFDILHSCDRYRCEQGDYYVS